MYAFDVAVLLIAASFRDREILYGIIMVIIYTLILDKNADDGQKTGTGKDYQRTL